MFPPKNFRIAFLGSGLSWAKYPSAKSRRPICPVPSVWSSKSPVGVCSPDHSQVLLYCSCGSGTIAFYKGLDEILVTPSQPPEILVGSDSHHFKMRLTVAATSFLLPGNSAWHPLKAVAELIFSDFSDWGAVLFRRRQTAEICEGLAFIVFLSDVISSDAVAALEREQGPLLHHIDDLLAPILLSIDQALANGAVNPLIVAWNVPHPASAIRSARRTPIWELIAMRWQGLIRERQSKSPGLLLLSMDNSFAIAGYKNCFDIRNYYAAHCHLSPSGVGVLAEQIAELILRWTQPVKKVLALDCDNTLWGGVIGEDGLAGIRLGQDGVGLAYTHFQRVARALARAGTLLVLVSKNQEWDVWEVFAQHPGMVLSREDIVSSRINWKDKSANLVEIADELGLGLDSFVFWDDNFLEREAVCKYLPQVTVPDVPADVVRWAGWLESTHLFASFQITQEDVSRSDLYQSRARFISSSTQFTAEADFLKSIHLRATCVSITEASVARAAQLTNKTNQFNLRTRRYNEAEIRALISQPGTVSFLAHLQDKFGDHGQVGLVLTSGVNGTHIAFLDTFLLSCRVLGRHLEAWMLKRCIDRLRDNGFEILLGEFIATERNNVSANFLQAHGLTPIEQCDPSLCKELLPFVKGYSGQLYAARLSDMPIPYLELYS